MPGTPGRARGGQRRVTKAKERKIVTRMGDEEQGREDKRLVAEVQGLVAKADRRALLTVKRILSGQAAEDELQPCVPPSRGLARGVAALRQRIHSMCH